MGMNQVPSRILGPALLLVALGSARGVAADSMPTEPDAPHDGISLGVRLGPGFLHASFYDQAIGGDARLWGQSYFVSAWAGFSITPRLVLSVEFNTSTDHSSPGWATPEWKTFRQRPTAAR
jgi:hypothetical protein